MALKTATIFKDFTITANGTNTAVKFVRNDSKTVSVKNDNFAQQVQIYDSADTTDFFSYKYITFDNSAVFEITDCIKNEKFTTLFIQYLSNITFDTFDSNFKVDGVTSSTLQKLGLNINEFLKVLGQSLNTDELYLSQRDLRGIAAPYADDFLYAIKLRFSERPNNIKDWFFTGMELTGYTKPIVSKVINIESNAGYTSYTANAFTQDTDLTFYDFNNIDNAYTVLLFLPIGKDGLTLHMKSTAGYIDIVYTMPSFLQTLATLITNLTISAELTILKEKSMPFLRRDRAGGTTYLLNPLFSNVFDGEKITGQYIDLEAITGTLFKSTIRAVTNLTESIDATSGQTDSIPVFVIGSDLIKQNSSYILGFGEAYNFIKLNLPPNATNKSRVLLSFMGNTFTAERLIKNELLIKRMPSKLRLFFDYDKNDFNDIETTFEFAKSAYSNYEAYKKSNIELVNRQEQQALQLRQSQAKEVQTLDLLKSSADAAQNAIFSFALGNAATGVASLASSATGMYFENQKFNLMQQNEVANLDLKAAQALEYARAEIVPTNELAGSITLSDVYNMTAQKFAAIKIKNVVISAAQKEILRQYVFDNTITTKVTAAADIVIPDYLPDTLMQFKIANRDPRNTRKGLIILGKKGS